MKRLSIIVLVLLLAGGMVSAGENGQRTPGNAQLSKTTGSPVYTFMNINNISTVYRNDGTSDIDVAQQNSGLGVPEREQEDRDVFERSDLGRPHRGRSAGPCRRVRPSFRLAAGQDPAERFAGGSIAGRMCGSTVCGRTTGPPI